jgi:hypothetical protein
MVKVVKMEEIESRCQPSAAVSCVVDQQDDDATMRVF